MYLGVYVGIFRGEREENLGEIRGQRPQRLAPLPTPEGACALTPW